MNVTITDKLIKHVLDLSPEEEVLLLRYKKLGNRRSEGSAVKVVSPVVVVCDNQRFQVDILEIEEVGNRYDVYGEEPEKIKKSEDIRKLDPFDMILELTPDLFREVVVTKEPLILFRVLNVPAYIRTNKIKIVYDKSKDIQQNPVEAVPVSSKPTVPTMVVRVEKVRPVDDLLKQHITDSAFFEVFIQGNREEFYDAMDADLDELVGMIGIKRRVEEGDVELRKRVIEYLKMRTALATTIKDEELNQLVKTAESEAELRKKLDDATKKKRSKKNDKRED